MTRIAKSDSEVSDCGGTDATLRHRHVEAEFKAPDESHRLSPTSDHPQDHPQARPQDYPGQW